MKGKVTVLVAIGALAFASGALAAMVDGTSGDDRLRGTMQADVIRAFAGDDFVNARAGNDLVRAGGGDGRRAGRPRQRHRLRRRRAPTGSTRAAPTTSCGRARATTPSTAARARTSSTAARGTTRSAAVRATIVSGPARDTTSSTAAPATTCCTRSRRTARGHARLRPGSRHGVGARAPSVATHDVPRLRDRHGRGRRRRADDDGRGGATATPTRTEAGAGGASAPPLCARSPPGYHSFTIRRPRSCGGSPSFAAEMAKILIIEDDDVIAQGMARHLQAAGFDAVGVANGETGLARLRYERPDVCVLDLMLPGVDGWKVIEQARGEGIGTPIVVVSARGTEHDRVHALEIGADDYLVKPFSMKELVARVGAAARRGTRAQDPRRGEEIVIEELRLDPRNVQAYVDGESADLTPTEFRLALRARPRDRSGPDARRAAAARLGPPRVPPRPHGRRLRPQAPREDRRPRLTAHVPPDALRRRLQARGRAEVARGTLAPPRAVLGSDRPQRPASGGRVGLSHTARLRSDPVAYRSSDILSLTND